MLIIHSSWSMHRACPQVLGLELYPTLMLSIHLLNLLEELTYYNYNLEAVHICNVYREEQLWGRRYTRTNCAWYIIPNTIVLEDHCYDSYKLPKYGHFLFIREHSLPVHKSPRGVSINACKPRIAHVKYINCNEIRWKYDWKIDTYNQYDETKKRHINFMEWFSPGVWRRNL